MPLQYSVKENHPEIKTGPNAALYIPVPKEIAETHENGHYALFNDEGEKVSNWCLLQRKIGDFKPGLRNEAKDGIKQTIKVGDYVAHGDGFMSDPLQIGKVIGFTPKSVRVLSMGSYPIASAKLYSDWSLIRLPETLWT